MLSTNKKNTWALFLNQSVQGASHKRDDKPLQDFSISGSAEFSNSFLQKTRVVYAIVADGHGGAKYFRSARGSQLACVLCENSIQQLFNEKVIDVIDENKIRNVLSHFCNRLILKWRDTVIKDFKQNELSENEKIICDKEKINYNNISDDDIPTFYGSTLLAVVCVQNKFWFAIQLGDGKCVGINYDETIFYPIEDFYPEEEDGKFICGRTASLCNKDASSSFKISYGFEKKILGLACMTDGVADSFSTEKLPDFILKIRANALDNLEKTKEELASFLPELSKKGSMDDVSISALFLQ